MDNAIVGIALSQGVSNMPDTLYAASRTKVYASLTFTNADAAAVKWYLVVQIGVGDATMAGPAGSVLFGGSASGASLEGAQYMGSEFRGIAPAPRTCTSPAVILRRELAGDVDTTEDGAEADSPSA